MGNLTQPSIQVLLVDDDTMLLRSLSRVLSERGFEVDTAICAAEARAILKHRPFDVVVCDQNMPGQSGLELLTELKQDHPDLIAMLLSGQVSGVPVAQDWAKEIGVSRVFSKPCDGNDIAHAIYECMEFRKVSCSKR